MNIILPYKNMSPFDFFNMIKLLNNMEIMYLSYLCFLIENYDKLNLETLNKISDDVKKTVEIAGIFKSINLSINKVISLFVQIKEIVGEGISLGNDSITRVLNVLNQVITQQYYNKNNIDYNYNKENDIKDTKNWLKNFNKK